jgi:flagellar motor switch protein FliG
MSEDDDDFDANRPEPVGEGAQRAAAVLLGIGPEVAANIFKLLDETVVRQIALGARELRKLPQSNIPQALSVFVESMDSIGGDAVAGDGMLRELAAKVMGVEAAQRAFDGTAPPPASDDSLGAVSQADPEALAMILAREQPQTAALVLGAMEMARAGMVLKHIPEHLRPQVLRKLATLETVDPDVLREVGQAIARELSESVSMGGTRRVEGKAMAAQLLRRCPPAQQSEVVAEIEKEDPELGAELRSSLFTFEDLANLADRDIQTLIREIDMGQLAVGLKGASMAVKDKLLKNMSSRAAQMLNDDIAAMGPVKLAAVEAAQAELVKICFNLAEQGRVSIVGPTERMV